MRRTTLYGAAALAVAACTGCLLFSLPERQELRPIDPAHPEAGSALVTLPAERGVIDQAADAARAAGEAGVPYAGLLGSLLGALGAAGTAVQSWRIRRRVAADDVVKLIDHLKEAAAAMPTAGDAGDLTAVWAQGTEFNAKVRAAWARMKPEKVNGKAQKPVA